MAITSLSSTIPHAERLTGGNTAQTKKQPESESISPSFDISDKYVVEVCGNCEPKTINLYSVTTGDALQAYKGPDVPWKRVCTGPDESLFTCSSEGEVAHFKWVAGQEGSQLRLAQKVRFADIENVYGMCYVPTQQSIILTDNWKKQVVSGRFAYNANTDGIPSIKPTWITGGIGVMVGGKQLDPTRLVCDDMGRVYIADGTNKRIVVLDAVDGHYIQQLQEEGWRDIRDVGWGSTAPQLIVASQYEGHNFDVFCYTVTAD